MFFEKSFCFTVNKVGAGVGKNKNMTNQELAEELHKSNFRKFGKRKVHSSFIDHMFGGC